MADPDENQVPDTDESSDTDFNDVADTLSSDDGDDMLVRVSV
jgi:hypothetical protein